MNSQPLTKNNSIDGLQYLRGIAALMVVFFHSRSYFPDVPAWTALGSRGVDLFFVISGFIMAYSTRHIDENSSLPKESLIFLSRRIIRVVPLYWLALLWTSSPFWINWLNSSSSLSDLYSNLSPEMLSIAKDFFFIPHFSIDEDEYGEVFPILIQGWTLNYEMFFYALFGFCILFRQHRLLSVSLILISLVVLGKLYKFTGIPGLFYTQPILLEFVFGIMVFHVYKSTQQMTFNRMTLVVFGIVGFLLLNSGSSVNDKFVLAVAAAIIVWVFIHAFRGAPIKSLAILGDASYSIYLFHPAAFVFARWIIASLGMGRDSFTQIILIIMLQVLIAIVVGLAIYYWIEKPMLAILRNLLNRFVSNSA